MRVAPAVAVCLALLLAACVGGTPTRPSATPSGTGASSALVPTPAITPTHLETPSPTLQLGPTPARSLRPTARTARPSPMGRPPSTHCVNGWTNPFADSPEMKHAFDLLKAQTGEEGPWSMEEMRYFTGPDVPWIIDPHFDVVDYWYVKAWLTHDRTYAARWLLEYRSDDRQGIAAVAPFDTAGYRSPDWTAFTGDGEPRAISGLPGKWSGVPYDFVTGEGDSGQPGLPDQVVGCLAPTVGT